MPCGAARLCYAPADNNNNKDEIVIIIMIIIIILIMRYALMFDALLV